MGSKRAVGSSSSSSSSSIAQELFGGKGSSPSSSTGLFNSVFPPAQSMAGRDSHRPDVFKPTKKQEFADQHARKANPGPGKESGSSSNNKGSAYQGQKSDPCFWNNSVYYGGQDICSQPSSHTSESSYKYNKDEEDDSGTSHFASRGNWWQGSLYY